MEILKAPPARFSRKPALAYVVWLALSGTVPVHIFVPALPDAARDLGVSAAAIQLSVTAYLIGLSIGQLVIGMLSDRFGRRPVLIVGLLLYVVASIVIAAAQSLELLLVARVVQAVGGCSGLVLGRAITRDAAGPERATSRLAILGASVSIGPGLAPMLGALITDSLGWRWIFVTLAAVNALLLLVTVLTLPETFARDGNGGASDYARRYMQLMRNPAFLRYCVSGAFATTSFYAFVGAGPFIMQHDFGLSLQQTGYAFLGVVSALTVGSLFASRMAGKVRPTVVTRVASVLLLASSLAVLLFVVADALTLWRLFAPILVLTFAIGLCSAFAMTEAINVDPEAIGAASGLYGCLQMAAGAGIIAAVGAIPADLATAMSIVLVAANGVALLGFWLPGLGRRKGAPGRD